MSAYKSDATPSPKSGNNRLIFHRWIVDRYSSSGLESSMLLCLPNDFLPRLSYVVKSPDSRSTEGKSLCVTISFRCICFSSSFPILSRSSMTGALQDEQVIDRGNLVVIQYRIQWMSKT
jgi:hypothetical protein